MRAAFVFVLIAAVASVAAAGIIDDERNIIDQVARTMNSATTNDAVVGALQQLASALGDTKALSELRADTGSDEFNVGLRSLLADVNRAMWVFYDDKPTLDHLRTFAKRIHAVL
ncbi:hypothetical protein LPJ61_006891 [Coemansia biformis]|uniref:Uncharacterized protein n=1 Tax=Coemansia biformis TaxID=1286918 RepID=A0A9W7XST1_9FUNG|nr:hypothetical protein LPJ61_006891 [Coemansia biformis]